MLNKNIQGGFVDNSIIEANPINWILTAEYSTITKKLSDKIKTKISVNDLNKSKRKVL